jgi:hypothetical protein
MSVDAAGSQTREVICQDKEIYPQRSNEVSRIVGTSSGTPQRCLCMVPTLPSRTGSGPEFRRHNRGARVP